jgi:hypothetical protein
MAQCFGGSLDSGFVSEALLFVRRSASSELLDEPVLMALA